MHVSMGSFLFMVYYYMRCENMTKSIPFQQMLLHQINIPAKLLTTYKELGLNEIEVIVILQLHRFLQDNNDFPTPQEIATHLTIDEKECSHILRKLIQQGLLEIIQWENEQQQLSEAYSLNPLWERLFKQATKTREEEESNIGTIFILFEQEFGRPLSPFEIETINAWLDEDEFLPALIKAALREAVLMGKLNFTYIDRILRDWKKKGIHTVEDARESSRAFRDKQKPRLSEQQVETKKVDQSLYYNWLEEGE